MVPPDDDDDFIDLGDPGPSDPGPAPDTPEPDDAPAPPDRFDEAPPPGSNGHDHDPPKTLVTLAEYRRRKAAAARGHRGAEPPPLDGQLVPITPDQWYGVEPPARQWVVEGWIPARHVTGLYASGGTGKTLLAQQLMTCIAAGRPFLGLSTVTGPVLGLFCEDDLDELHRRQVAICQGMDLDLRDLGDRMVLFPRVGHDNTLMAFPDGIGDPGQTTELWAEIGRQIEAIQPVLVIVDTLADTFAGNENDRLQPRRFVQACLGRWCQTYDTTVLGLAHPSRSGEADKSLRSGSTAWEGALRSRLGFRRPDRDPDEDDYDRARRDRILTVEKANYAVSGEMIKLQYDRGHWTRTDAPLTPIEKKARERSHEKLILDELTRLVDGGEALSMSPNSPAFFGKLLPKLSEPIRSSRTLSKREMENIVYALWRRGFLTADAGHKPPRQRIKIVKTEPENNPQLF